MNMKINILCFILLLSVLIGCVSAADNSSDTFKAIDDDNHDKLEISLNSSAVSKALDTAKLTASKSKANVNLKASNVKMHFKDSSHFKVILKDNKKQPMKKTKVKIQLDGVSYNKLTDSKGCVNFNLNVLNNSGTYKIVTTYAGSSSFQKKSITNTIVVVSTIKSDDLSKFYKNTKKFTAKFYDKKGKLLKNKNVRFKISNKALNKTFLTKTNKNGLSSVDVDVKPGTYSMLVVNNETGERIYRTVTIKTVVESHDLVVKDNKTNKFNVKILNPNGKPSPNRNVFLTVNGKMHVVKTNSNGIASLTLDLNVGKYSVTINYDGLSYSNKIDVITRVGDVKKTEFTHSISISNYVNVSCDYVFHNSGYALKTGSDGIIKLPKKDVISIEIKNTTYLFSQSKISGVKTTVLGYNYYLIPFNSSPVQSDYNKDNLKGEGIIISNSGDFTNIEYKSHINDNSTLLNISCTGRDIIYCENSTQMAKINYITYRFDESGLKYNLARISDSYIDTYNDADYITLTNNNTGIIRYTSLNDSLIFSGSYDSIIPSISSEDIKAKFYINKTCVFSKNYSLDYSSVSFDESYNILNNYTGFKSSVALINGIDSGGEYSYIVGSEKCVNVI